MLNQTPPKKKTRVSNVGTYIYVLELRVGNHGEHRFLGFFLGIQTTLKKLGRTAGRCLLNPGRGSPHWTWGLYLLSDMQRAFLITVFAFPEQQKTWATPPFGAGGSQMTTILSHEVVVSINVIFVAWSLGDHLVSSWYFFELSVVQLLVLTFLETSIAPENGWLEYVGILVSFLRRLPDRHYLSFRNLFGTVFWRWFRFCDGKFLG